MAEKYSTWSAHATVRSTSIFSAGSAPGRVSSARRAAANRVMHSRKCRFVPAARAIHAPSAWAAASPHRRHSSGCRSR